jgi:hypothetical protein
MKGYDRRGTVTDSRPILGGTRILIVNGFAMDLALQASIDCVA